MTTTQDARNGHADAPDPAAARSRTVTWRDPAATHAAVASMSGLSYWHAVVDGRLPPPPIGELLLMRVDQVEHGRITFNWRPDDSMYNPLGMVHGGAVCTLLDTVTACALHTTLPE